MSADEQLYLSGRDAATLLGVSMATLYTYVSRGMVRVQRLPGQRESRYWRSDIERMKLRPSSRSGNAFGSLTGDSTITLVTKTGTFYRGRNVGELAETHSLEAVAALLWDVDEADVFGAPLPLMPDLDPGFVRQIAGLELIEKLVAMTPLFEAANPRCFDPSRVGFAKAAAGMLRLVASMMVPSGILSTEPIHEQVVRGAPAAQRDNWAEVARRLLVLSADHDLDPTTLAARAVANTGVTPYRVMLAGLIAGDGRRGVQMRIRAAERLLAEMSDSRSPATVIRSRLHAGEALPGFGPYIHIGHDTRVDAVLATYRRFLADDPDIAAILDAVDIARDATGLEPQFILVLLAFNRKLRHVDGQASLLRLARIVGWMAHALEQSTQEVVRPRSIYRGPLPE